MVRVLMDETGTYINNDEVPLWSDPSLTAIIFFHPKFANANEIIELLDFLDTFSEDHLDIFIKGFRKETLESKLDFSAKVYRGNSNYLFSDKTLLADVKKLQKETSWKFSMEIDVVLVTSKRWRNPTSKGIEYDYKNAITINLYRMMKDQKISSYASFFSELIRFSEEYSGNNPVWDISDKKLFFELKKSLFESFKKYLGFRNFQIKVEDYAVKNISRN